MSSKKMITFAGAFITGIVACGSAYAHPGHEGSLVAGMLHPLYGVDHLLAMLAVGIWASKQDDFGRRGISISFIVVMALGAVVALAGFPLKGIELGIVGSLLLCAALIGLKRQCNPYSAAFLAGVFAFFHGFAHGSELPSSANTWLYIAGFTVTTALLLTAGQAVGQQLKSLRFGFSFIGAILFAGGSWLAF